MSIFIDTGPIIAFLDRNDAHHDFVEEEMKVMNSPLYTCEAVITESFFLLQRIPKGIASLIELIESDKIKISFDYSAHFKRVHWFIKKYTNVPMSFADACLVRMAETAESSRIFTLDSDFSIYRTSRGKPFSLISPF